MSEFFKNIPEIKFEGKDSKNPWAFKYYNPEMTVMGKKMSEHLPFAMAWWHNLGANGRCSLIFFPMIVNSGL